MKNPANPLTREALERAARGEVRTMFSDRQTYDGAELRPFTGRPGSMDAFKLPSRDGDTYRPYVGPRPQCVGVAQALPFSYSRGGEA